MSTKGEHLSRYGQDSANEVAWTYEIPFQYAWVAPEAVETTIDPESAAAFIESEFPSVCRVRVDLAAPNSKRRVDRVHVWQLRASCPFCDAGKDQLLSSRHWVDVYEWSEDMEADLQNADSLIGERSRSGTYFGLRVMHELGGIEKCLDWQLLSKAMRAWGLKACLESHPSVADEELSEECGTPANGMPSESSPEDDVNVYGISLAETLAALSEESSVEHGAREDASHGSETEAIAREFGIEGYFGGAYRCEHCGNTFAIVFRDPWDDTKEGRYRLMAEVSEALDRLLARWNHTDTTDSEGGHALGHVPTMSAHVSQGENRIAVRANIAGRMHELSFDTANGSFLLDDDSYVIDDRTARLSAYSVHNHPLIDDCLSEVPGLMLGLLAMLPPLPEGVDVNPTKLQERGYGINLLVAANRFVGYPAAFYNEMALTSFVDASTCGLELTYPFESGLPRNYSDVETLYKQTGLPDDERLKRALADRPQVLLDVLRKSDLPFESIDVLSRFFQLPQIDFCMRVLDFFPKSAAGWRRLVEAKGEEAVFSYIEKQANVPPVESRLLELEQFGDVSAILDALYDSATDEQLASVRMDALHDDLMALLEANSRLRDHDLDDGDSLWSSGDDACGV